MAKAIMWHGSNKLLKAPADFEDDIIRPLPTFNNGRLSVSCWELSKEEISDIIQTGCVYAMVLSGPTQPPIMIGSEEEVRNVAVDYGKVWVDLERQVSRKQNENGNNS